MHTGRSCRDLVAAISDYIDGELTAARCRDLETAPGATARAATASPTACKAPWPCAARRGRRGCRRRCSAGPGRGSRNCSESTCRPMSPRHGRPRAAAGCAPDRAAPPPSGRPAALSAPASTRRARGGGAGADARAPALRHEGPGMLPGPSCCTRRVRSQASPVLAGGGALHPPGLQDARVVGALEGRRIRAAQQAHAARSSASPTRTRGPPSSGPSPRGSCASWSGPWCSSVDTSCTPQAPAMTALMASSAAVHAARAREVAP